MFSTVRKDTTNAQRAVPGVARGIISHKLTQTGVLGLVDATDVPSGVLNYDAQVSTTQVFGALKLQLFTATSAAQTSSLSSGQYFWRVRAATRREIFFLFNLATFRVDVNKSHPSSKPNGRRYFLRGGPRRAF